MLLSQSVEYALRMMSFLAIKGERLPVKAKDISAATNIPVFYSSKILRSMVTAGLLKAEKGHGGGFVLAKPASRIKFIHIFEAIEGKLEQKRCAFGLGKCSSLDPCPLHHRWSKLIDAFQKWAKNTSLADVRKDFDLKDYFGNEVN